MYSSDPKGARGQKATCAFSSNRFTKSNEFVTDCPLIFLCTSPIPLGRHKRRLVEANRKFLLSC